MFFKIGVLKGFVNFTGKHLCWSLFFDKVTEACNFIKKRLQHSCFPAKFANFFRTFFCRTPPVAASVNSDPFLANVPVLYPPENTRKPTFSNVLRGKKLEHWPEMG